MRVLRRPNVGANGMRFRRTVALLRLRFSAVSITNIAWRELRHEAICDQTDYLRRTTRSVFRVVPDVMPRIFKAMTLFKGSPLKVPFISADSSSRFDL